MMPQQTQVGPEFEFMHPDDADKSKAVSTAVFIETEPEKEISMTARLIKEARENPAAPIRVKVVGNYRVVHEGKPYVAADDAFEIPDDAEHKIWLQSGWVEKVSK
jgi:hypothetical protein